MVDSSPQFIHLRLHTEYSLVNGLIRLQPLVKALADAKMPAVAVTDQNNLFAAVKFYRAAIQAGIKPIIGVDLWVRSEHEQQPLMRLVILCQDRQGYLNLTRLVTRSYLEGQYQGIPTVHRDWFVDNSTGLIALSGGRSGDIGQALVDGKLHRAAARLGWWRKQFPDRFYLELQRTGRDCEEEYNGLAMELAVQHDIPVVATNDVHFLRRSDFEAHEARVCIADGRTLADPRRPRLYSDQQYLRDNAEMAELFADVPAALQNSVEIARRCNLELTFGKNVLPEFPVPEDMDTAGYFRNLAKAGLQARLQNMSQHDVKGNTLNLRHYEDRLHHEIDVIENMGFPGYFLIVADFIRWAKDNGVPVGPGRGSGAGSLVAYALGITDLDPLRYDLLFERFLNPERVSLPDFDIDFCMMGRDRVIDYVARRYGTDRVAQIITYGSMAARAVVRDVGRVLGFPYGFVDQIAKLIPMELGITLDKALAGEELLKKRYDDEEDVHSLLDLAHALEGLARNAGRHAGGVVIAPAPLTNYAPLYCEQGGSSAVTQFDKDDVEAVGLVKFDFLGLRTLTIIDRTVQAVNAVSTDQVVPLDIGSIPMDDTATFDLLRRCATTAVFQLESRGMKDLIKRLQPDCFDEIIALVALFRPGPLQSGMVDDFIDRKHARARVDYPHADLEPILKPTYGVILYQEQVMQIAQVLAGYTLGEADLLRRAMGKKKPAEMARQRDVFVSGAARRHVDQARASYIFDLMEKFAGYGFNKSHSAAYALLAYQTAYLKAHYPAAFMAAVLSSDMEHTDKVVTFIDECRCLGLALLPPHVNSSDCAFTARDGQTITYGLGAIKGVGTSAITCIVTERKRHGDFKDLFDLCRRLDLRKVNRRALDALVRAGALDGLGRNRASMMAVLPTAMQVAEKELYDRSAGQDDMFAGFTTTAASVEGHTVANCTVGDVSSELPEWSEEERLMGEKETLGLYLTGHPISRYESELYHLVSARIVDLRPTQDQTAIVAGLVVAIRRLNSRHGDRMAFITLDDRSGRLEIAVFADSYTRYRDLLVKDKLIVVEGNVSLDEYSGGFRMSADKIFSIDQARTRYAKSLLINVDEKRLGRAFCMNLAEILGPYREGGCPIRVDYQKQRSCAQLLLGRQWQVQPTDELLNRLGELAGREHVRIVY